MLADVDVTEQQWRVLRVLDENGAMDPTSIAEEACLLMPSLTRMLQKLEEKELILRDSDPFDGRKQRITVTPAASSLIQDNMATTIQLSERLKTRMGDAKYEHLLDLLNELDALDLRP